MITSRGTDEGVEIESGEGPARAPLRVGLLLTSLVQPRWVHRVVTDLVASTFAELALVVVIGDQHKRPSAGARRRARPAEAAFLYSAYSIVDRLIFRAAPDPLAPMDMAGPLSGCPVLRVTPTRTEEEGVFLEDADIETIAAYGLDVAVLFTRLNLRGRVLGVARYGVWSHEDGERLGFWEVMEGRPVTESVLTLLDGVGAPVPIYRAYARTDARSAARNRDRCYWRSSAFLLRQLRALHDEVAANVLMAPEPAPPPRLRPDAMPTNGEMARMLRGLAARVARDKLARLVSWTQWVVAYRIGPTWPGDANGLEVEAGDFIVLTPPRDRFWADPFPVKFGNRYFILFEEWISGRRKAHISVAEVDEAGLVGRPVTVLEREYHLSYPFVFWWDGSYYMLPETAENGTVELYRAVSFPDRWEFAAVLMSGLRAVDATIAEIGDRWWMFLNVGRPGISANEELHLFHAETPLGPWRPHARNPVKADVRSARSAGRVFSWKGRNYRPAQDCSVAYGRAIVLNRIETIDAKEYRETPVARIGPTWRPNVIGTHTINAVDDFTVIDARLRQPRLGWRGSTTRTASSTVIAADDVAIGRARTRRTGPSTETFERSF